ncbi:hypothetical protein D3C72_999280 [compost metagenome]
MAQGIAALERTGEAHRLNRRMLDQPFADTATINHVEHTGRHSGFFRRADDRVSHPLGGCHVPAVGLEHHRATGSQCRGGIATGSGKCQREVAGTEHRYRSDGDAVLAQIRTRQRLTIRQCPVNARTIEIAATQHLGEQA